MRTELSRLKHLWTYSLPILYAGDQVPAHKNWGHIQRTVHPSLSMLGYGITRDMVSTYVSETDHGSMDKQEKGVHTEPGLKNDVF